ncbi:GAF domain-containing protein [Modestobacter muralis]|uniref:GAF domain-containing protein n=1 Tax=Modestobacter muralis TaxID=1608614 RepID=A0A6P0F003_9ACTN|nr:GAF domain-containing protein [Modestobacter muralis]NEK96463.1 GAF domain-containing protein [Modestobacter muralis]NEN53363.1 GAF domain-containing protein [Modestobacter muralis]
MTMLLPAPSSGPPPPSLLAGMDPAWVSWVLDTARQRLGVNIAWLSEFTGTQQHIHAATGDLASMNVRPGMTASLEGSFCVRVLTGQLPPVVTDATRDPRTRDLPVAGDLNIGSYVGVPIRTRAGEPVGMLCVLSPHQNPHLTEASARHLEFLAQLISDHIGGAEPGRPDRHARRAHVLNVLDAQQVNVVFQPVVHLDTGDAVAYEALARFPAADGDTPRDAVR